MSTAQDIVTESLEILNLSNGFLPVDPRHQQVGFRVLVDLLIKMKGNELNVVRQIPSTITQELYEVPNAKLGLVYELAYYLSAPLQIKSLPPTFEDVKNRAMTALYVELKPSTEQQYPEGLPTGSGNEYWYTDSDERFYGKRDENRYQIYDSATKGEQQFIYADFGPDVKIKGSSVSSVVWSILDGASATISSESLTSNVAKSLVLFSESGTLRIKAQATYANTEKKDFLFNFEVV